MDAKELKEKYYELNDYMIQSKDPKNMKIFGRVMDEMFEWFVANKPDAAQSWIEKLESVKWKNYLAPSEADKIVAAMKPQAPWTRDQWNAAMEKSGYEKEEWPCFNKCAIYTTMNMIMSDSSNTLSKYMEDEGDLFAFVHDLALDKLHDADGRFNIREYFHV